ncbi:hypothetical protein QG070_00125 [Kingella kingae]|uniref:Uncharacterized protein n=2 Tax=Kingella kingae TaxID=504 RepID=F5S707_KINKI|nr:hypothetical protein [Kingella kingae]EGK09326.1 hypothetical protein HMPREF0476_0990 [Kingella kingae ATCC 23330]MDK4525993.1 hypothetical protein [Kingella kingae]MDK4531997.1 hypothetical protein [Kingella kingae]MDK4533563.1 hypothetical protein [Kingella kingae]MDK4536078.1 hypothetical protein [Kingella kingae]
MPTTLILDPKIYEFETKNAADEYTEWLQNEVRQSRLSPIISEEQAMNRLDANRAKLLERMKNVN